MDHLKIGGPYGLREKVRFINRFRNMRYDTVYVLGTKFRHAVFAYLTGARNRVGYANHHRGFLLTKTADEPVQKNLVERFLDLLVLDGMQVRDPWIELHLSDAEKNAVDKLYAEKGMRPGDRLISLAPFSADMRRTWGLQRFWQVARHFAKKGGKVILLGSPQDRVVLEKDPPPYLPDIIDLVGRLSVLETAAAIQKSALFLGNDSGLGHIAGAVGAKTLILGYHVTREWYPLAPSVRTIIKDTCHACHVGDCYDRSGGDPECFSNIAVEEVIGEMENMLTTPFPRTEEIRQ
jgi:ADP-heptose:LPS heptosyltransferase